MPKALLTNTIKEFVGPAFYRRGLDYWQSGRVQGLIQSPIDGNHWTATVHGSESYSVTLFFNQGFIADGICECPSYFDSDCCKHIAAALIAMAQDRPALRPQSPQGSSSPALGQLMAILSGTRPSPSPTTSLRPLMTQFLIHQMTRQTGEGLAIEMKLGESRLYVIPKIRDFLANLANGHSQRFSKNFQYDPSIHQFTRLDNDIIGVLQEAVRLERQYDPPYSYSSYNRYHYGFNTDRQVYIPPVLWERLWPLLQERQALWAVTNTPFVVQKDSLAVNFSLTESKDGQYALNFTKSSDLQFFPAYGAIVSQGKWIALENEHVTQLQRLYGLPATKTTRVSIPIDESNLGTVMNDILPMIRPLGTVSIAPSLRQRVQQSPLHCRLYLDWDGTTLNARLEYHYGSHVFHPGQQEPSQSDVIVIRDRAAEDDALRTIKLSGFSGIDPMACRDPDQIYAFLHDVLPTLEERTEVFVTSELDPMAVSRAPKIRADIKHNTDWLSVDFELGDLDPEEFAALMGALKEKRRYHRLKNGAFMALDDPGLQAVGELVEGLDLSPRQLKQGHAEMPLVRALPLSDLDAKIPGLQLSRAMRQWLDTLQHPDHLDLEVPKSVQATLREYQRLGFQWMSMLGSLQLGGILADDMGLGKTLQTITYIAAQRETGPLPHPVLIVAPSSLIYNWQKEFERFAPHLITRVVAGGQAERHAHLQSDNQVDVLITSYPLLRRDQEAYADHRFYAVIFDEAQALKNPGTQTAQAATSILSTRRIALTGTPVENSLDDLWSIFHIISPELLGSHERFSRLNPEQVAKRVQPFILRRLKKDVLQELPDKIESVQSTPLSRQQKMVYMAYLEKIKAETKADLERDSFQKSRMKVLAGLTRLRQICCHPGLFIEDYHGGSSKLDLLMELTEEAMLGDKHVLVFSQFTSMLGKIRHAFSTRGWELFYLDGDTPTKERLELVDRFNAGERRIFLISLKAGGTGLNLTGADTVILYDLWWNPAVEEQAIDRAHRIGQKKSVQVIRLMTQGTVEEKIYALQESKRDLIDQVVSANGQAITALTEADVREILEIG